MLVEVTFVNFVSFVGKSDNFSIRKTLVEKLSENFNLFFINKNYSVENGKGEPLILFSSEDFIKMKLNSCIFVFDEDTEIIIPDILCENAVAIINSSSRNQISQFVNTNISVITCGSSQKDTFTYSSYTDDKIVVSLQRSIKSISGKIIEPFELPVLNNEKNNIFSVLAYIAVLTQFDKFEKNYL